MTRPGANQRRPNSLGINPPAINPSGINPLGANPLGTNPPATHPPVADLPARAISEVGVRLGGELLRGRYGIWFSGRTGGGRGVGVLRLEQSLVELPEVLPRLVERAAAARAAGVPGLPPGALPVLDLIADTGRVWLVTGALPTPDTARVLENALLGDVTAGDSGVWRPEIPLAPGGWGSAGGSDANSGGMGGSI